MPRPRQIELRTEARKTNDPVVKQIVRLKQDNPKMSAADIARATNRNRSSVTRTLKRYGLDTKRVTQYNSFKADILAGINDKIAGKLIDNVDNIKIETSGDFKNMSVSLGIIDDHELLARGKATQIVQLSDIVELIDKEEKQKLTEIQPGQYKVCES
jgi:IS30 family transposase